MCIETYSNMAKCYPSVDLNETSVMVIPFCVHSKFFKTQSWENNSNGKNYLGFTNPITLQGTLNGNWR